MMHNNNPPSLPLRLQGKMSLESAAKVHAVPSQLQRVNAEADTLDTTGRRSSKLERVGYTDYSGVQPHIVNCADAPAEWQPSVKEPTFPVKLHMILANPEFEDIIAWLPHGRSWRIIHQKAFEERVLPLYFRHGRYSSFARQVNGWGFQRVTNGSDYNSYYHEMFLIRMPHLCEKMKRLTSKDAVSRGKNGDAQAPNFYELSRTNPLPGLECKPAANHQLSNLTQNRSDLLEMGNFIADRRRAIGLASLFLDSGAASGMSGGGGFTMLQGSGQGGGWGQSGLNSLQNFQNVNAGLLYGGNLMSPSLSAMGEHLRRMQILKSGSNGQELAKLMAMNMAFPDGMNMNF